MCVVACVCLFHKLVAATRLTDVSVGGLHMFFRKGMKLEGVDAAQGVRKLTSLRKPSRDSFPKYCTQDRGRPSPRIGSTLTNTRTVTQHRLDDVFLLGYLLPC